MLINPNKDMVTIKEESPPIPIVPSNTNTEFTFLDLDSTEIARQLTLICFEKYKKLNIEDIKAHVLKKSDPQVSPVASFIEILNDITLIAASSLVIQMQMENRVAYFKKWISVMTELVEMKNYSGFEGKFYLYFFLSFIFYFILLFLFLFFIFIINNIFIILFLSYF